MHGIKPSSRASYRTAGLTNALQVSGTIPRDVYSISLFLFGANDGTGNDLSACALLDVVLMCAADSPCLYKGNDAVGCFDLDL